VSDNYNRIKRSFDLSSVAAYLGDGSIIVRARKGLSDPAKEVR